MSTLVDVCIWVDKQLGGIFESSQDVEEGNINEKLDLFDCKLRISFD